MINTVPNKRLKNQSTGRLRENYNSFFKKMAGTNPTALRAQVV